MALGRRKDRNSYGVPVRPASEPALATAAAVAPVSSSTPAADFYSPPPVTGPPAPSTPAADWQGGYQPWNPQQSYAPPVSPPLPPASRTRRSPLLRAAAGLLIPLAFIGYRGYRSFAQSADISAPTAIAGYQQVQGAQIDKLLAEMKSELQNENPGKGVEVAAYGRDGTPAFLLGLVRGEFDVDKELEDVAATKKTYGRVTCAKMGSAAVGCLWSGSVSGGVVGLDLKMAEVAKITQAALDATK